MVEVFNKNWPTSMKIDVDDWCNIYIKKKWRCWKSKSNSFYIKQINYPYKDLHRFILKTNLEVDHINGDTLDNRRCNLRSVTRQQNLMNQKKQTRKTTSKYKGVSFNKTNNKWSARITLNRKLMCLGSFKTEEIAAEAYNAAAKRLFGEYAKLNIIEL